MTLRKTLKTEDLHKIEKLLREVGVFTSEEQECCLDLARMTLEGEKSYYWFLAEAEGQLIGLICYGPVSLTVGTYDLYWILRSPRAVQQGVGKELLTAAESHLRRLHARLFVLNTSGTPPYEPACGFYLRNGFELSARLVEYYRPGDDLLIYTKRLE